MASFRYHDRGSSGAGLALSVGAGALVGFIAGAFFAQRSGGFAALTESLRGRFGRGGIDEAADGEEFDLDEDEFESETDEAYVGASLEENVLEAYMNDPILSERAVDIGEIGEGIIELAGWVETEDEAEHAVTLARGVVGVDTVVNRLNVGEEEEQLEENFDRYSSGDDALTEGQWEGQQVGTGARRQGSSAEANRHADPHTDLQDKWLSEQAALENAAEDMPGSAERHARAKKSVKGDRTGGSPIAPTGVPKSDHVAAPLDAPQSKTVLDPSSSNAPYRAD